MKGMFGSGASSGSKGGTVDTLIGRQTEILGDVRFAGGLYIDGRIKGMVSTGTADGSATLSLSETGVIEGDVRVPNVVLNGTVIGDVRASEKLVLNAKAKVTGTVYYKVLQMEPGATINGQLVHDTGDVPALTHQKAQDGKSETAVLDLQDARRSKHG
ncbi:polymer-forming cytoskeletal protein [Nevskia sp.]|uniref:bactofilin family protein n=1 Tax=Nevskia sp. TaxID=1929292 RepID=UPI0025E2E8C5|nr:polymer-forming cytoskeletal protein [Nevskia sp.]